MRLSLLRVVFIVFFFSTVVPPRHPVFAMPARFRLTARKSPWRPAYQHEIHSRRLRARSPLSPDDPTQLYGSGQHARHERPGTNPSLYDVYTPLYTYNTNYASTHRQYAYYVYNLYKSMHSIVGTYNECVRAFVCVCIDKSSSWLSTDIFRGPPPLRDVSNILCSVLYMYIYIYTFTQDASVYTVKSTASPARGPRPCTYVWRICTFNTFITYLFICSVSLRRIQDAHIMYL